MNTIEIKRALRNVSYFKGVFPSDRLPRKFSLPAIFIVNLDSHRLPGSHWICITISDNQLGCYFDSYGSRPTTPHIIRFLRKHTRRYTYNRQRLQSSFSQTCGHYASLFALFKAANKSTDTFVNLFSKTDLCANDRLVLSLFKRFLGKCKLCDDKTIMQSCLSENDLL